MPGCIHVLDACVHAVLHVLHACLYVVHVLDACNVCMVGAFHVHALHECMHLFLDTKWHACVCLFKIVLRKFTFACMRACAKCMPASKCVGALSSCMRVGMVASSHALCVI